MALLANTVASVRLLEETEAPKGKSGKEIGIIIGIIIGSIIILIGVAHYSVARSKVSRHQEKIILASGEDKLRRAFENIEENGSKDFEEMQVIRGKIVEWEEKQRMKQQMIKGRIMQQLTLQSMF